MKDLFRTVPCTWCGEQTRMTATQLCDGHYELLSRIRYEPEMARRMLASVDPQEPIADITVDGSFVHVAWRKGMPDQMSIPVYEASQCKPLRKRYRHLKTGGNYEIVSHANVQAAQPIHEGCRVIVYRSEREGSFWVRSEKEFLDGRFEEIK